MDCAVGSGKESDSRDWFPYGSWISVPSAVELSSFSVVAVLDVLTSASPGGAVVVAGMTVSDLFSDSMVVWEMGTFEVFDGDAAHVELVVRVVPADKPKRVWEANWLRPMLSRLAVWVPFPSTPVPSEVLKPFEPFDKVLVMLKSLCGVGMLS